MVLLMPDQLEPVVDIADLLPIIVVPAKDLSQECSPEPGSTEVGYLFVFNWVSEFVLVYEFWTQTPALPLDLSILYMTFNFKLFCII